MNSPYMHGGHFEDLEAVVRHYAGLTETPSYGHSEDFLVSQELSDSDVNAVIEFLLFLSKE
jgi:cytochrome c peroxidase